MDGLFVTNVAHIPNSFHYSHLFQWSSGSSFPRGWHYGFRSGPLFRSSGHPTNAPLCYHPALERSPSTSFSTPSLWKLVDTRDKRCASLCPTRSAPFSIDLIFSFQPQRAPWTNAKEIVDFNFFAILPEGERKWSEGR